MLVYYKDSFHYKSERDSPIGLLELSHCTGIYSSSSDNRVFTVRSVDVDFVLKARFEDSVEGWKTAIQCSWDLARKDFEIQEDALNENSVLNQVIDLELKLHSIASPDKTIAEFLSELTSSFTVHYPLHHYQHSPFSMLSVLAPPSTIPPNSLSNSLVTASTLRRAPTSPHSAPSPRHHRAPAATTTKSTKAPRFSSIKTSNPPSRSCRAPASRLSPR